MRQMSANFEGRMDVLGVESLILTEFFEKYTTSIYWTVYTYQLDFHLGLYMLLLSPGFCDIKSFQNDDNNDDVYYALFERISIYFLVRPTHPSIRSSITENHNPSSTT